MKDVYAAAMSSQVGPDGNRVSQKRAWMLNSEIDFGLTLIAVARASSAAGDFAESSKAIQHAESTFMAVRNRLQVIEISPKQRESARERVTILEEILASVGAGRRSVLGDAHACDRPGEKELICGTRASLVAWRSPR